MPRRIPIDIWSAFAPALVMLRNLPMDFRSETVSAEETLVDFTLVLILAVATVSAEETLVDFALVLILAVATVSAEETLVDFARLMGLAVVTVSAFETLTDLFVVAPLAAAVNSAIMIPQSSDVPIVGLYFCVPDDPRISVPPATVQFVFAAPPVVPSRDGGVAHDPFVLSCVNVSPFGPLTPKIPTASEPFAIDADVTVGLVSLPIANVLTPNGLGLVWMPVA